MLYYEGIEISERIDINKISESEECSICYCCYFLGKGFKIQPDDYNGCHDVLMMSMKLSGIAILNIDGADYHCIISRISKSDAINLMQNNDLSIKIGTL